MTEMSMSRHCKTCDKQKRFIKHKQNTFWGIILTIGTFGVFLLYWIPLIIWQICVPYRCVECGRAYH